MKTIDREHRCRCCKPAVGEFRFRIKHSDLLTEISQPYPACEEHLLIAQEKGCSTFRYEDPAYVRNLRILRAVTLIESLQRGE